MIFVGPFILGSNSTNASCLQNFIKKIDLLGNIAVRQDVVRDLQICLAVFP